jgi:sarcosine oxidase, subunit alpha
MNVQIKSRRTEPQTDELIDRSRTISFTFNGRAYSAHPGDTIASALAAAGVKTFSRSFKYHRPRGLLCCAGHCPNCLVQVGEEPNVRACTRSVTEGLHVSPQNAWPSLDYDLMSLTALADRFLPVGFYYKTFMRPQALWPVYEHFLRHAAGLGEVHLDKEADHPHGYDKQYLHADVVVVGGGPAGISAAQAAAKAGARVTLFEENSRLGGHLRFSSVDKGQLIVDSEGVSVFTDTTVLGYFDDHWLAAVSGTRLYKIRAGAVVFATGLVEQPLLFDNNDLPGVMLGSGVARLLHLYGVVVGQTAVIVTANEDGWQLAADLQAAGVNVAAIADQRPEQAQPQLDQIRAGETACTELAEVAVYFGHTIQKANGRGAVKSATLIPLDGQGQSHTIPCDLIVLSVGYAPNNGLIYQAGGRFRYDEGAAEFLPGSLPPGIFVAGRVAGSHSHDDNLASGSQAGQAAAAHLGFGAAPASPAVGQTSARTSDLTQVPSAGGKQFLCFCEDVTDKDLQTAVAEGFNSVELLKRYSTISMGPCQGKMCSLNTIRLCAQANGWSIEETGTTTARPPTTPVKLASLAGQPLEPVRYTPIHPWHEEAGANMMVAGLWLRPEHYGDPLAEVEAVRQRAGLIDVSTLGKLRLTGPGVPDLLDKLYVNKWQTLPVGRVRYGLMCNDEGIILDDGVTARIGEQEWYMSTTSGGASSIYEWIEWWVQSGWGDGVHVTNVTENYAAFNLAGPQSRAILQPLTACDLSDDAFPYMGVRLARVDGILFRLLRIGFTGELSYEIHCPAGKGLALWQKLMAAGEAWGIRPFGVEAQRVLRLEKGHLIVGHDTDALTDPFSADMGWAVKLDKADFLGQRALTRLSETGIIQRLVGFTLPDKDIVPEEGLQIVQANTAAPLGFDIIGWITSCRYSPTLDQVIGLCWLPAKLAASDGAGFTIWREGKLLQGMVRHGAFYDAVSTAD